MGRPQHSAVYAAAVRRFYALGQGRMLPGRERLRHLLARAGDPHLAVPSILIGGTNGKGRLTTALSAALSTRYKTGAFIKPHLKSIRERWRINDIEISEAQFAAVATRALDLAALHERETGEAVSFFEACVLLGALLFRDQGCEVAVWEVGLGGRQDACNLCEPFLSIITNVQLDHQAILGNTLEEIAADKAYIARPDKTLLLGPARAGWEADYARYAAVIRGIAEEVGALYEEVRLPELQGDAAGAGPGETGLPADTLALLAAARPALLAAGLPLAPKDIAAGITAAHYRGRMERTTLAGQPVLIDAAHNPDSMRWLGGVLSARGGREQGFPVIFGCQSSREPLEMLSPLAGVASSITPIAVPVLHPCPPGRISAACAELGLPLSLPPGFTPPPPPPEDIPIDHLTELDPPDNSTGWIECVRHGLSLATAERPAVICGSIYYIGEILRAFEDGWL